jgi:hypothetical protein
MAAMSWNHFRSETTQLMSAVVGRGNVVKALRRVERKNPRLLLALLGQTWESQNSGKQSKTG